MNLLEELRRQRELIRQHLDWLDRQIESIESESREKEELPPGENPPAQLSPPAGQMPAETTAGTEAASDESLAPALAQINSPRGNEIQRAKFGCLMLFICSTLLFLFLLFGLPYLWD